MEFIKLFVEITLEIICTVKTWIKNNLRYIANVITVVLVYGMYAIGQYVFMDRGYFGVGGEVFIPLVVLFIIYYIRSAANKLGKGSTIPVPEKRFTEISEDGEVNIENDRVQELILYLADLEDWMERKDIL